MRVTLQLVICHDDGQKETVTDVITLNKNTQRIEHLGLTLAESKQLLSTLPATPPPTATHHLSPYPFNVPRLRHTAQAQGLLAADRFVPVWHLSVS